MGLFSDRLRGISAASNNAIIENAESFVSSLITAHQASPSTYRWNLHDPDSLGRAYEQLLKSESPKRVLQANRLLWIDMARNIEAYSVMVLWRGGELLLGAVASLESEQLNASATLARSALELAVAALYNANKILANIRDVKFDPARALGNYSEEWEQFILRLVWGTRLPNHDAFLKQTNILTLIQKIATKPGAEELLPRYEVMCDLAHPNFLGNMVYCADVKKSEDETNAYLLTRPPNREGANWAVENVLWTTSWSAYTLRSSVLMLQQSVQIVSLWFA